MDAVKSKEEQRRQKAAALRYKRPALDTLGYDMIRAELDDIYDICTEMQWADEELGNPVMDDDEDTGFGYRAQFSQLADDAYRLSEQLDDADCDEFGEYGMFDDCTVGLIGDRFDVIGYDAVENDYFQLCRWDAERAKTAAGKRLMRLTKSDMLDVIGRNVGVLIAFYDIRQRFDYLRTALDIVTGHNLDTLHTVHSIETAYDAWVDDGCVPYNKLYFVLENVCNQLADIYWVC